MVSHKMYNLNPNHEGYLFFTFLTSNFYVCFSSVFTPRMNSLPIAYLISGSEHINWNLEVECEVHSIQGDLQECNDQLTFKYIWTNHLSKHNKGCALVGQKYKQQQQKATQ